MMLNKDMTLCISLSAQPSNNGTRSHNRLYEELGLNRITRPSPPPISRRRSLASAGLGSAVSMPYKEDVIALADQMDPSATAIDSVNDDGVLAAYNTDYSAIAPSPSVTPPGTVVPRPKAAWLPASLK
ncbi:hypothetical protein [Sphaerisporangium sp. NPDC051011]|uniref:hypothetical protein n=1 Tax=Sphaerisporangium sp. NPDC051011 TaxID=3155792 RepID=UPI003408AD70